MKAPKHRRTYPVLSFYAVRGNNPNYHFTFKDCGSKERCKEFLKGFENVRAAYYSWYDGSRQTSNERIK